MTLTDFTESVVLYCWITDASVTSWGRTRRRNVAVGGCPRSPHLVWKGVDVVYDDPRPPETGAEVAASLGLTLTREGDHDHLQPRDFPPCRQASPVVPPA